MWPICHQASKKVGYTLKEDTWNSLTDKELVFKYKRNSYKSKEELIQ